MVQSLSRRDRVRAETTTQIKHTARRILIEQGPDAVSLRAIAREMGMTAPALYRYFGSRETLLRHVVADIFREIAADVQAAITAAGQAGGGDLTTKFVAACREFRRWSLAHRQEFGLLFGTPLPSLEVIHDDVITDCAAKFSGTFFALFLELWRLRPFPIPPDAEIDPGLREQLARYRDGLGASLPLGAMLAFLRSWVRLYGMVSLEVFGHLHFALEEPSALFEYTLAELAGLLGLAYPVPEGPVPEGPVPEGPVPQG